MGRRIFFLLGVTLLTVWVPARVLGQSPQPVVGEFDPAPAPSSTPETTSAPFPTPAADFPEPEPLPPPAEEPSEPTGRIERPAGIERPAEIAPEIVDVAAPKRDAAVERTQAAPGRE